MGQPRRGRVTRALIIGLLAAVAIQALGATGRTASASSPGNGTVSQSNPTFAWDFTGIGGSSSGTDSFALTVQLPSVAGTFYAPDVRTGSVNAAVLSITMTWADSSATQTLGLAVTDPSATAVGNDTSALTNDGSNINVFMLQSPANKSASSASETYTVTASNQGAGSTTAISAHAVATLQLTNLAGQPQPAQPAGSPGFDNYHIPLSLMPPRPEETTALGGRAFGEPSIGVDPSTNAVMYQAGLYTIKATFNSATPSVPAWSDVSDAPLASTASLDAILDVDRVTGRTFVSQLAGCSLSAYSTDDGGSWTPAAACQTPAGPDHQTIGAGPFHAPVPAGVGAYPDAVYYCSQSIAFAGCALSVDGGASYLASSPMWTSQVCFGLHGHVKVTPSTAGADAGTVYVPNKACGSPECLIATSTAGPNCHPGFAVSTNNGTSWTVHTITDGHTRYFNSGDPSIGIGAAGTMYYGYGDRDGHPKVAVCTNDGATCSASVDVSGPYNIQSTELPTVVAGDDNRAAFAFLGSSTPGDDQENSFVGTWHLYVAVTYDSGQHWHITDATPNNPIQRGCIEFNASCPSSRGTDDQRNLLDFNDLTIDAQGRVLAAYTDGCQPELATPAGHGTCLTDATRLSGLPTEIEGPAIARQNCGLGLYAQFDAQMTACALAANVPETPAASALLLGGLSVFGITGVVVWRRRRRQPAL